MLRPLGATAGALASLATTAVFTKLRFRRVTPFVLSVPMLRAAPGYAMVTWFCDQSAAADAVAPTIVTVAAPGTLTASEYVPGKIVTVGIALFWAASTAALIAVNCPDPSAATVMADLEPEELADDVAEGEEVMDGTVAFEEPLWAAASPKRAAAMRDRMVNDGYLLVNGNVRREWR
jgi:hypothetical protein